MFILFIAHQSNASNKNLSIKRAHILFIMYTGIVVHIRTNIKHTASINAKALSIIFLLSVFILYVSRDYSPLLNISSLPNVTI